MATPVNIKGMNNNLIFMFGPGSFDEYYRFLNERLTNNQALFHGSSVLFQGNGMDNLSPGEITALQKLCLDHGILLNNTAPALPPPEKNPKSNLIIHRNVRSGQNVRSEASIVIWGDVHESAEIIAGGDIIILGKLKGIAHAGYFGDQSSSIFALALMPGQIRIANLISQSPEEELNNHYPEIAFIENGKICIEKYTPREAQTRWGI